MPITTVAETLYTIEFVPDRNVDMDIPCPECSDEDAVIIMNLYVRHQGQCTRFVECCLNCGQRIAVEERPFEVLFEIPESLRAEVSA